MKSRFATVKRPLLALTALAALMAVTGILPAHAVNFNNLSFSGTTGLIRVRPIVQDSKGASHLNTGDPNIREGNPNRTVGDVPATASSFFPTACAGVGVDCLRTLANNDSSVNPSAAGGITRYNAGDTNIIVNDVSGFQAGDTLLIGSPYCNFPTLGTTCKRFLPGFGIVNEQPNGEIVTVTGGDVSADAQGVGVLQLASPLTLSHLEGSTVTKLPTLYQGQQFRVDIDYTALLGCDTARTTCNPNNVNVDAKFLPPDASHNPSFASRPLALNRDNPKALVTSVAAACGPTTAPASCGAGFASFYIPSNITTEGTVGPTFSTDTPDTWYSVVVTAKDAVDGHIVADGIARFKLNTVAIRNLTAQHPTRPAPAGGTAKFFPGEAVQITAFLRDGTALSRPVEDVLTAITVQAPDGGTQTILTVSCANRSVNGSLAKDTCGGDVFQGTTDGHGSVYVQYGGPQGIFINFGDAFSLFGLGVSPTPPGPPPSDPTKIPAFITGSAGLTGPTGKTTCNPSKNDFILPCTGGLFHVTDTLQTGTYTVTAQLGYKPEFSPKVHAGTSFEVNIK